MSINSFADDVNKISTSIFVTNFHDQFYAKDLWRVCKQYRNVVDAFIPHGRSKVGKRFGFVRFIRVSDIDRLVNNLCTIWVDRWKLYANKVRFHRLPLNKGKPHVTNIEVKDHVQTTVNSFNTTHGNSMPYINAVTKGTLYQGNEYENKQALVLDDSCLNQQDFSKSLIGKVKEFSSLTNLKVVLENKGFNNITVKTATSIISISFRQKVTWVNAEGIPLKDETSLHSRRICIKTKLVENIFESFKIIVKGKIYWVRAKEVSGWTPDFNDEEDEGSDSDEDVKEDNLDIENVENED
nr:DIE2/ALG10 family [Tanacetum cinerariifolium]